MGVVVHLQISLDARIEALTFTLYLFMHLLFEDILFCSIALPFLYQ